MSQMFLNVVSTFKGDGLAAATRQLGAFGSAAGGLGSTLGKVGAALASFGVATKAVQFTQKTIDEAKNLQQNLFALDLIFGKLSPEMENFAKNAANIGLSQAEAAKASVFLGSVMKQSGFGIEDVADKTQTLVSLASDLALVYQYDVQEALLGMTALFRGEYDPIEKFGVAMKQSEINAELAAKKLSHLTGEQRRLAEQTIRYELFLERAADSMGAFGRSSGNLAAESLKLSAEFKNMQSTVGAALLPTITDLVIALKPLVEQLTPRLIELLGDAKPAIEIFNNFLRDLGDETTTTSQVVGHFADSLGTIFRLIAENFGTILTLTALIGGLRIAFVLLTAVMNATPIGFVLTGLGLLAGAFVLVNDAAKKADDSLYKYNVELMKTDPVKQAIAPYMVYQGILGKTASAYDRAAAEAHGYKKAVEGIPELNLTQHQTELTKTSRAYRNMMRAKNRALGNVPGFTPGEDDSEDEIQIDTQGSAAKSEPSIMETLKTEATKSKLATKLIGKGLMEGLAEQITERGPKAARKQLKKIRDTAGAHATKLNKIYKKTAAGKAELDRIQADSDRRDREQKEKDDKIAEDLAEKERQRVEEQQRVYKSFADSVKGLFGGIRDSILGAFDITGLGGSTNSILRNMEKMLTRLRSFSASVKQLATMGLDPALLQQIIGMGPMAGATLASRLVQGGAGALASINAGYAEFGSLATDIATTGTNAMFGRDQQQTVYNINVSGGVGSGSTIGKAIVDAIKDYERTSGAVWQGA